MNRFVTEQPGITTYSCFSYGPHYDPDRMSFGPVIGLDEHVVAPGAGFDWHAHAGVTIVSWVLAGTLRHRDSSGAERLVRPAELLVQRTGGGIRHEETNAAQERLRLLQVTVLGTEGGARVTTGLPPLRLPGVEVVAGDELSVGRDGGTVVVHLPAALAPSPRVGQIPAANPTISAGERPLSR